MKRRVQPKFLPWLLALAFLAVQAAAFAHELQHDLRQHGDASCVLHLHAKQAGQPAPGPFFVPVRAAPAPSRRPAAVAVSAPPALGYRTRAPPRASVRST